MWEMGMIGVMVLLLAGCSDKDDPTRADKLKGSVWAGEFSSETGSSVSQPFSIIFGTDNSFKWYDETLSDKGGTWATSGEVVTLTFSSGGSVSATAADTAWTAITTADAGLKVKTVFSTKKPDLKSLDGTTWKGLTLYDGDQVLTLAFGAEPAILLDGAYNGTCSIWGAGVLINMSSQPHGDTYYFVTNTAATSMIGVWEFKEGKWRCDINKLPK